MEDERERERGEEDERGRAREWRMRGESRGERRMKEGRGD